MKFFVYSRSWLVPTIRPLLFALGAMPNFRLWLSDGFSDAVPKDVPQGIRIAWLQHDEAQPPAVDLVFRVQKLRKKPTNGLPVCEHETVEGRAKGINCSSCRLCWN